MYESSREVLANYLTRIDELCIVDVHTRPTAVLLRLSFALDPIWTGICADFDNTTIANVGSEKTTHQYKVFSVMTPITILYFNVHGS